jgi:hypothetical protein
MKLTDETVRGIQDDMKPGYFIEPCDMIPLPETIGALATEVLESRAEIARLTKERNDAQTLASLSKAVVDGSLRKVERVEARVAELEGALRQADEWFRAYAQGHYAKGDWDKAKRNHDRADYCNRAALGRDGT